MWQDHNNPDRNVAETDFLNRWILRYPVRVPLILAGVGLSLLAVAYFGKAWRAMAGGVLLLVAAAFLLVYGLARKLGESTSVPFHCPNCGSAFSLPPSDAPADGQMTCPDCAVGRLERR